MLSSQRPFSERHIGPNTNEQKEMLTLLGFSNLEELSKKAVPESIQLKSDLNLPKELTEVEALEKIKLMMAKNKVYKSFIGQGYYDTIVPGVILRNILENPGWYTQYTPYQSEIAQGRLEALLNFQTMISDLTGLEVANASMLDEGTSAAEAMSLAYNLEGSDDKNIFFVSELCHPQVIEVIQTRAEPIGIKVIIGNHNTHKFDEKIFGCLLQYPATDGVVFDYQSTIQKIHDVKALAIVAADLMSLAVLKAPGEFGADIAIGNTQRFGVPLGFGGPHAAYFATKQKYIRQMPGRLVGVSIDSQGRPGFRLTLQTREQHIRREKATSNICTAQVLLAIMASMYAVYHGPRGIKQIALHGFNLAHNLGQLLQAKGFKLKNSMYFDTISLLVNPSEMNGIFQRAEAKGVNLRKINESELSLAFDECKTENDVLDLYQIITGENTQAPLKSFEEDILGSSKRTSSFLTHEVFNRYHSETEMLRYIFKLQNRDLSLAHSMIALGSCTMKLNATAEMIPVTWPEVSQIHPFAPQTQTQGYAELTKSLESWLSEITGFDSTSLQPNAGSQGEYAGLQVIRKYHSSRGEEHRNICLIPSSAHGTNPASAAMVGMKIVVVACDDQGNIDINDLKTKAETHSKNLAALMVTYPSTHGVFEEGIKEICSIIHRHGGQVYMDGANMNAQVGLCRPGDFGPDVCHLNLHKTFSIPHGGGGPGMGPICVAKHLTPYLPAHRASGIGTEKNSGAVSSSAFGSASILPISWMYIAMMGTKGLKQATQVAILNANYIAKKLSPYFPVLYMGKSELVAHECILDFHLLTSKSGISVEDVAKRLMDYNYHAPTISFPVAGTIMVEPTESESKAELDRFCEAMISIYNEIKEIIDGKADKQNNLLKNAPHPANMLLAETWDKPYSRERAAYPLSWVKNAKFWPYVGRINNPHGDRNIICSCPPIESYS